MPTTNIAIFVSGRGSNAKAIIEQAALYRYKVSLIISSKSSALALELAKENQIDTLVLDKNNFLNSTAILEDLKNKNIGLLVLAGFLWKIPTYLIQAFPNKIVNIHPSLLPKYGGKGMYGMKVHQAVVANNETETGITIHLVNEEYDKGKILYQERISLSKNDSADEVATKVLALEHQNFARIIDQLC